MPCRFFPFFFSIVPLIRVSGFDDLLTSVMIKRAADRRLCAEYDIGAGKMKKRANLIGGERYKGRKKRRKNSIKPRERVT